MGKHSFWVILPGVHYTLQYFQEKRYRYLIGAKITVISSRVIGYHKIYTFSLTVWLSDCLENVTDNLECPTNTWNLHSYFTVIVMLVIPTNVKMCYWTAPLVNVVVLAMRGSSVFTFSVCLFVCMSMCQVFATPKYGHGGKKKAIERRGGQHGTGVNCQ